MRLSVKHIRRLLEELEYETIFNDNASLRLQKRSNVGYSKDPETAQLQGALSIMLEAAARTEAEA